MQIGVNSLYFKAFAKLPNYLQRFMLKPEPVKILKGLRSNPFKIFTVVRLIGEFFCLTNFYSPVLAQGCEIDIATLFGDR